MFKKFHILIAGHGFVGASLASLLAEAGHDVLALSKTVSPADSSKNYPLVACDLANRESVSNIDFAPDFIIHCASSNRGGLDAYRSVFLDGLAHLTEKFPVAHTFLTSSTSVYGQVDGSLVDENSPAQPTRETSQILRQAEKILLEKNGTVLRLAGIYGPGRSVHLKKFLSDTATIEKSETSRFLNQIHRDDIISAITYLIAVANSQPEKIRGQIFNLADATPITQRACYEWLADHFAKPLPPEAAPELNRKRAWTNKRISIEKIRATGWTPRYPSFFDAVANDPNLVRSIQDSLENPPLHK